MRTRKVIAYGVVGIPIAVIVVLLWNFNRPPFDLRHLQQLRIGMTQDEVRHTLGVPSSRYSNSWNYSRVLAWPMVNVDFDDSARLKDWNYDY